jgi:hypothetical protein
MRVTGNIAVDEPTGNSVIERGADDGVDLEDSLGSAADAVCAAGLSGIQVLVRNSPKVTGPAGAGGTASRSRSSRAASCSASSRSWPTGCHRRRSRPVTGSRPS